MNMKLLNFKINKLWYAVSTSSFALTWLTVSSVVQASDLQIYAKPEGGQTTVILMLDNSGSMNRTYTGEGSLTRLQRLKNGVNDLLTKNTVTLANGTVVDLRNAYVGLGIFTENGTNKHGIIKVPANKLGEVTDSNNLSGQRLLLKQAVDAMNGASNTPSAHAMAEAAAYLLGTTTYWENISYPTIQKEYYRLKRSYTATSSDNPRTYTYTYTYSICNNWNEVQWNSLLQTCKNSGWVNQSVISPVQESRNRADRNDPIWKSQPTIPSYNSTNPTNITNPSRNTEQTIIYYKNDNTQPYIINANSSVKTSGILDAKSNSLLVESTTASNVDLRYKSPLPENSVSCDGQGIYFLSDGLPNQTTTASVEPLMQTALNDPDFTCPISNDDTPETSNDLPNPNGDGGNAKSNWNCMGALAKRLYAGGTYNPKARSINTAFVGFGSAFANMTENTAAARGAKYACKLGSKLTGDVCSPDASDSSLKNPSEGFGNGGFYYVTTDTQVTQSIASFIKDNQNGVVAPLATGQITVPYDALNPNMLQNYGYLRALEPNPASNHVTWRGNLKKYEVIQSGITTGAFQGNSGGLVFDNLGKFRTGTKDFWNSSDYSDGGLTWLGGAYSKVPLPILGQTQTVDAAGKVTRYAYNASNNIRNIFTDISAATSTALTKQSTKDSPLLRIPAAPEGTNPFTSPTSTANYVLGKFNSSSGQPILRDLALTIKLKLLNYLGYNVDINTTTLPTSLTTSNAPHLSMGASIYSSPVQLTYSGTLDANGNLTNARDQAILYGSSEGGLHLVDASSGEEKMVFIPADILEHSIASKGLVPNTIDSGNVPTHGVDATWVSDAAYNYNETTTKDAGGKDQTTSQIKARKMNIYGGLRMGGSSYYGLDVLNPASPKFLFRIYPANITGKGDYSRLGQTWSKPVLANVRHNGQIKRAMIVGGGYDMCYENPRFQLSATVDNTEYPNLNCTNKPEAQGNAIYVIDASDGTLIWSATYDASAAITDGKKYLRHSIVSRISTLDRDADGLVDHLYFGDLGGQIFRVDLNNNQVKTASQYSDFGVRVVRLADLATNDTVADSSNDYTGSKAPRFYESPTVTIHDEGAHTFITLGIASGDRSTPLDVSPTGTTGRDNMKPAAALTDRPVNNVYGIIDKDFIKRDLITGTPTLETINKVRTNLRKNPQILASGETVSNIFFPASGAGKDGWYRSLSSTNDGTDKAIGTGKIRVKGGLKAFEEPIAITGNLMVPVYDPEGTGVGSNIPCMPRVVGETDWQTFCLPFGVCLKSDGTINSNKEQLTGFKLDRTGKNSNVIGPGIRSISLVPKTDSTTGSSSTSCGKITMAGNTAGTGEWQCTSHFIPTRWYERYR
ncbi:MULTISPECIES: PilC/PilY family type IV pilus protein [unclassified Acinetobacter]|uniref:PilC/PilY family type IV pilus protein n=1 Tax=unclassified Acinetobacter TaxID=196816 RepID=UPI0015D0F244|nr:MULTISPECIES: PilC/PilY family type IV pilus protein [unclassified Acinetobacter]